MTSFQGKIIRYSCQHWALEAVYSTHYNLKIYCLPAKESDFIRINQSHEPGGGGDTRLGK